jgi:hypothetical protein
VDWQLLLDPNIDKLNSIYRDYCKYKRFASVMPIFDSRYTDSQTDVLGYYDQGQLVAFSLIKRYDDKNALCDQFAWNYHNPKLRLGIETLKTECAVYREQGFHYLYLEQAHLYKQEMQGFELLGPVE